MVVEMTVPQTGESITEVQIAEWLKSEGDTVQRDEAVVEIETDKASMELPSPASGKISKIVKHNGDTVGVGEVIAYIEENGTARAQAKETAPAETPKTATSTPPKESPRAKQPQSAAPEPPKKPAKQSPPKAAASEPPKKSPPPEKPALQAAEPPQDEPPAEQTSPQPAAPPAQEATIPTPKPPASQPVREEETVPMTMLRRRVGERLLEAQHNAALLTTFNEVDMSAVVGLRQRFEKQFQERYGTKLGFMSFFVKASVAALMRVPEINAEIRDQNIVYHKYYDIGVAVSTERGLVVPVLRNAERMSFAQIEQSIADLAARARDNKLKLEELQGGTFTITNGGIFGSLLSTPIVNPPQSGILGLHAIQDRPIAREGQVVIRPMMYVALTYDHRIVDGREAVTFLRHIKELIEEPARMLIES